MRNGGVAILGSARAKGQNRAQTAIEQALNSPLLNDNDIRGAQWILININSKAGVTEFTMDEVETIQQYLLAQAGEDTDIILGLGYDETLGEDISITIIATGFEQKSALGSFNSAPSQSVKDDRIMLTLEMTTPSVQPEPAAEVNAEPSVIEQTAPLIDVELGSDETPIVLELGLNTEEKPKPVFQNNPVASNIQQSSAVAARVNSTSTRTSGFLVKPSVIYATPN